MVKITLRQLALPVATALVAAGCCSHSPKMASASSTAWSTDAQGGAPAVEQGSVISSEMGSAQTVNQADIELRKEELVVGKREISNGGVLVRKVVQTENVSQPVELRREEYVIERIPASDAKAIEAANQASTAFQPQEFYIPLTREEPVASKRTLLTENVQLGKRAEIDHETITRPVRWEDVEVNKVLGKASGSYWQESAPATASAASAASAENSFQLAREEMMVSKKDVDNGGVTLRKIVHTDNASQPIDLKREEFTIDRTPVSAGQVANADFTPKEYRLDLTREEAVAAVQSHPTEWVHVRKQTQTDNQIVTGTVRKENIEVVKLAANTGTAMGGTSAFDESGATIMSESGSAKEMTLSGKAVCAKCQLHETAACQNALQVQDGDKTTTYYLVQNDVSKNFHKNACKEAKQVTVTGSVQEVAGKLELTPTKIEIQ